MKKYKYKVILETKTGYILNETGYWFDWDEAYDFIKLDMLHKEFNSKIDKYSIRAKTKSEFKSMLGRHCDVFVIRFTVDGEEYFYKVDRKKL